MTGDLPAFARGLCDDAAVFPPGLAPLADAVPAHRRHRSAPYAALVGPLVLPATALDQLHALLTGDPLDLSITAPNGPAQAARAVAAAADLPVDVRAVEVAVPTGMTATDLLHGLERIDVPVFVEVPRDDRRPAIIAALGESGHRAKFRTGGVHANLYPAPDELAAAILAAVRAGVPFKATAGLHHPVRNTDPETGFHQHGFLNLLLATDAAMHGADAADAAAVLADRDAASVAARVAALGDARAAFARARFLSFGTCSITDPVTDLAALGLLSASLLKEDA
ncbi:hypothetical protein F8568_002095 [Actinomadura sp. LD22]|uniref:Uncharacterized protein n=1 Tax=Actinomadura physcomitrii TaxID=2650748 RepID=A0A6I4MAP7_9ACTN|nr:hypothetical protein [Actinomadura physcomitrii]MVZ99195.1 hypothetical protein [Actinomadura physcomitrii]